MNDLFSAVSLHHHATQLVFTNRDRIISWAFIVGRGFLLWTAVKDIFLESKFWQFGKVIIKEENQILGNTFRHSIARNILVAIELIPQTDSSTHVQCM